MTPTTSMSRAEYEEAARVYCESLPLEHFMEATTQSGQRAVTDASFLYLKPSEIPLSSVGELVVQYFHQGNLRQVVPDNMLIGGKLARERKGCWILEFETLPIAMTMEYVSPRSRRKDYVDSFGKYQNELKVPYYLLVDHERDELRLHRLDEETGLYRRVPANAAGRHPAPELELEVGWLDGWARFWYRGELVPIPDELRLELGKLREQLSRQAELIERQEEQLREKDDALSKRNEQIRQKDDALREKDDALRQNKDALRQKDDALRQNEAALRQNKDALRQKDDALRQNEEANRQIVASLRPLVELRARSASRQDILDQLPTVADAAQLSLWLAELN